MIDTRTVDHLQEAIARIKDARPVAEQLLQDIGNPNFHRQFIIESFMIEKFQRDYKEWEYQSKQEFLDNEVLMYNHKIGQMTKLNYEVGKLDEAYETKKQQLELPNIVVSTWTIKEYDETLLQNISNTTTEVKLKEIFSLDGQKLPALTQEIFTQIMTIEFRLRIERMIKYDILLKVKRELTAINRKWSKRNNDLNGFINGRLQSIIKEVGDIRRLADENEYNVEDEEEMEPEEQELEEENLEHEMNHGENDLDHGLEQGQNELESELDQDDLEQNELGQELDQNILEQFESQVESQVESESEQPSEPIPEPQNDTEMQID